MKLRSIAVAVAALALTGNALAQDLSSEKGKLSYYFGYDSAAFRQLVQRHAQSESPRERARLFAQLQRHLAEDAVNAWLYASQVGTVVRKGLRGVWMHYPIFVHDIAALRWESEENTA